LSHLGEDSRRPIYSISELTIHIKRLLEDRFSFVWISGEISNFRRPVSGHCYFTLKDDAAQINAVMFRGQTRNLKFDLTDGLLVTGFGRISVYEPRGTYQIILEYLEPGGVGALQVAFEQLRDRLDAEGLFDEKHKRPLPFLPKKISVVTSPTGAVIHDILKVLHRRYGSLHVEVVPVKVQGDGAAKEITSAIDLLNQRNDADVIMLARGGGSLEDLSSFNDEAVARAIFGSAIPVISAVGHETDYCIADFVADLRAPTPSAAAEMVAPQKSELARQVRKLSDRLISRFYDGIERRRTRLNEFFHRLGDPSKRIQDLRMRADDVTSRLYRVIQQDVHRKQERLDLWNERLYSNNPAIYINYIKEKYNINYHNLLKNMEIKLDNRHHELRELSGRLRVLNPAAILARGYSITRTIPDAMVIKDPEKVTLGQPLEILVEKGRITAEAVEGYGEKTDI